ncbi:polysaccharide deacetylase family protein [Brevibacillus parabrevis]|uniref:polysaccharide deacetylase family protein n=1 Tax=Brevibacillus parabrevis TaxID=54914 RepID=UPI0028D4F37A|nr:polysaccharide deacetylase family protein [Brevibacillus parabrevis]
MPKKIGRNQKSFLFSIAMAMLAIAVLAGCAPLHDRGQPFGYAAQKTKTTQKIIRYTGEKSKGIPFVYTTKRELALTFNGMADSKKMKQLLDALDKQHIKATFFLPGMRVAEEPNLAKEIAARGHEVENNTLNLLDLSKLPYDKISSEIKLAKDVIEKKAGIKTRYVRTKSATYTDDILLAAAGAGHEAVISTSLFLHNWEKETEEQKMRYVRKYINRGGIITMDTVESKQLAENVALLARAANDAGYRFVPLKDLIAGSQERKPAEQIEGYDAAKINLDVQNVTYRYVQRDESDKPQIALSFDDWGSDATVTKILDTLDKYQIKASFFLRADGVAKNPNLARAIYEAGHDVANHTYSHPVLTKITVAQMQEEIVKAHQIITGAIQQKPTMYFRPPTGAINDNTLKAISATGYHTITNFDVDPSDYMKTKTADEIANIVIEKTKNGSVILLHMLDDIKTVDALPTIIEKLREKGYTFVKMSEMFGS